MNLSKIFTIKYFVYLVGFLLLFLYINNFQILYEINRILDMRGYLISFVYMSNFLLGTIAFILLLQNKYTRIPILMIFFIVSIIDLGYLNISGSIFRYSDALLIIHEINSPLALEAIKSYGNYFIKGSFISLVFVTIIYLIFRERNVKYSARIGIFLYIISILFTYVILMKSDARRVSSPTIVKIPTLLYYVSVSKLYFGDRDKISISIEDIPKYKHIIYIVDESVRGDMLGINGFKEDTTPFLNSIKSKIYNYGIASSGATCSIYSNTVLLTGVQLDNLEDVKGKFIRKSPYIMDYAKYAGFKTSFFDMQNSNDKPDNYLQIKDFDNIDNLYFLNDDVNIDYKVYNADFIGLDKLTEYIHKNIDSKTFSYFLKQGSHFGYLSRFPKENTYFKPIMKDNSDFWEWSLEVKPRVLNTYYNTIRWGVDTFVKDLIEKLKGTDTLIIYTSDHAENIIDYVDIKRTHCLDDYAPTVMAKVPLFVIDIGESNKYNFVKSNINHASHFNIFGTILNLMGYNKDETAKVYGKTLFDNLSDDKRVFTSGDLFGRGNQLYKNNFDD